MRRRVLLSLALSLVMFAPACKKKSGDADADAKGDEPEVAAKQADPSKTDVPAKVEPTPEPVTPPADSDSGAAGSGGGGGGGGSGGGGSLPATDREDLTCEPSEEGACLEGEQCIGEQGCGAVWNCDADIVCAKGVREYCGCDGRTFEAVYGNCPWKKYDYPGPCK